MQKTTATTDLWRPNQIQPKTKHDSNFPVLWRWLSYSRGKFSWQNTRDYATVLPPIHLFIEFCRNEKKNVYETMSMQNGNNYRSFNDDLPNGTIEKPDCFVENCKTYTPIATFAQSCHARRESFNWMSRITQCAWYRNVNVTLIAAVGAKTQRWTKWNENERKEQQQQ